MSRRRLLVAAGVAVATLAGCGPSLARELSPGAGDLRRLKLVNWYPHDAAWSRLWTDASETEIARDFAGIAALGANAVRVIINAGAFGYPVPLPAMAAKLGWIVSAASRRGLRVQLTLFDFWQDYGDVTHSTTWMQAVLSPYRDDGRICFVELKNEVDPGDAHLPSWLAAIGPATKATAGSIPVTISVTSELGIGPIRQWVALVNATTTIDFFDVHWYGDRTDAEAGIAAIKAACGDIPLFIGETGRTSQPVGSQTTTQGEMDQADYLTSAIDACRAADVALPAPWVWQDFTPAALPFVGYQTSQLYFGMLRLDGSKTPAYAVMEQAFAAGSP